jgi:hypothetical protein
VDISVSPVLLQSSSFEIYCNKLCKMPEICCS